MSDLDRRLWGGRAGGNVWGTGPAGEDRSLPSPKLEVTSGSTVDPRKGTHHQAEAGIPIFSLPPSPQTGNPLFTQALGPPEHAAYHLKSGQATTWYSVLVTSSVGPRGSVVSGPPLFTAGACVSPAVQGEIFPEGNLPISNMLVGNIDGCFYPTWRYILKSIFSAVNIKTNCSQTEISTYRLNICQLANIS